ncbi:MAG: hypothetical protein ACK4TL_06260 [Hyphomicrobiaceae bacterium]
MHAREQEQRIIPSAASDPAALESARLMEAILHLADLISEVVKEEKSLIAHPEGADFSALVARKSHLALELGKLMKVAEGKVPSERVRQRLATLAGELAANERLLRRHMDAVYEISSLIGEAIEQSTADGTYSSEIAKRGPRPW